MPSSDIFQRQMAKVFDDFEDLVVYIDNIILYTKQTFEQHVKRLVQVLECIHQQNLHVHIDEIFPVDYLSYRLAIYVDVDHVHDLITRRSITRILVMLSNTPIRWMS
jgi:hypothetical protein